MAQLRYEGAPGRARGHEHRPGKALGPGDAHGLERLDARGKGFQAATQPDLHTGGPMGRLVLSIMGAFAEFERELIRERTREGIARARAEGKPIGKRGPDKKPRRKRGVALSTPLPRVNRPETRSS